MQNVQRRDKLLPHKGNVLEFMSSGGEVFGELALPVGVLVDLAQYFDLLAPGDTLRVSPSCTVITPRSWSGIAVPVGLTDSAANPDFVPTSATRQALEMQRMLGEMRYLNSQAVAAARAAALASVEVIPTAPVVADASPVVE